MEHSAINCVTSLKYKSAAFQRAKRVTSRVTAAVTLGLPSRSPPIQEAKCTGAERTDKGLPSFSVTMPSKSRRKSGTAYHKERSKVTKPHFASSTGVGLERRISSVHHAESTPRHNCWRRWWVSLADKSVRSKSAKAAAI